MWTQYTREEDYASYSVMKQPTNKNKVDFEFAYMSIAIKKKIYE